MLRSRLIFIDKKIYKRNRNVIQFYYYKNDKAKESKSGF